MDRVVVRCVVHVVAPALQVVVLQDRVVVLRFVVRHLAVVRLPPAATLAIQGVARLLDHVAVQVVEHHIAQIIVEIIENH